MTEPNTKDAEFSPPFYPILFQALCLYNSSDDTVSESGLVPLNFSSKMNEFSCSVLYALTRHYS